MSSLEMFRLNGAVAVVTGASRGLGAALAVGLAEAGADVALVARGDCLEAQAAIAALGRRVLTVQADIGVRGEGRAALARVEAELGRPRSW